MRGLLDGAISGLITKGETYGYEILEKLKKHQFPEIGDSSIYPVLLGLGKKGYVHTTMRKSGNSGPNRRYCTIPESRLRKLQRFREKWQAFSRGMNHISRNDNNDK